MPRFPLCLASAAILCMASPAALAHTALESASPASGSILEASPEEVTLTFAKPVILTSIKKVSGASEALKLEHAPKGRSASYTVTAPDLATGRNEIQWTALSPDGHVIEGSVILVIKPTE